MTYIVPESNRGLPRGYKFPPRPTKKNRFNYTTELPTSDAELGYLCGLIATDGNLSSNSKAIGIGLKSNDLDTVQWVASKLNTTKQYSPAVKSYYNGLTKGYSERASIRLVSPSLYDYLVEMGITPTKTYTLDPKLDDKSDEFLWYFLRGVIDGDGCVYTPYGSGGSLKDCEITIASASLSFLETLQNFFGGYISTKPKKTTKLATVDLYTLGFTGVRARVLSDYLPTDGFTMQRKTDKLNILKSQYSIIPGMSCLYGTMWKFGKREQRLYY